MIKSLGPKYVTAPSDKSVFLDLLKNMSQGHRDPLMAKKYKLVLAFVHYLDTKDPRWDERALNVAWCLDGMNEYTKMDEYVNNITNFICQELTNAS